MGEIVAINVPPLASASAAVTRAVATWPGVGCESGPIEASLCFSFRQQTLGHLYAVCGDFPAVDAVFPPPMGEALIALGRGERHPVVPDAGWVFQPIRRPADIAAAIALLRDNYDRLSRRLRVVV
jgi:hypothetical protein